MVHVKITPDKEVLASLTWNKLVLMSRHRTTEYHNSRRRSQSRKKWTEGVYYWSSNTTHGNRTKDLGVWVRNTYASQERSQAERELKVCFRTLAEAATALREGDLFLRKWTKRLELGHIRSDFVLGQPSGPLDWDNPWKLRQQENWALQFWLSYSKNGSVY